VRPLVVILALTLLAGCSLLVLALIGVLPRTEETPVNERRPSAGPVDRFDERRAFERLERQVELGPRPAGSPASRALAEELRRALPNGRFEPLGGGLRNVVGSVPGRERTEVVVGAHYDTKDLPGFGGANDGASGTATVVELARTIEPGELRPTIAFVLFDGEESPAGTAPEDFEAEGLRGSKRAAARYANAEAMVLLDFVGDRDLSIPREGNSDEELWARLRDAAARVGQDAAFPDSVRAPIADDHVPFLSAGVPAIDLIDFDFPCFHRGCDDLAAVSPDSLDAAGETVYELLRTL